LSPKSPITVDSETADIHTRLIKYTHRRINLSKTQ
jgi:hypothetical protein